MENTENLTEEESTNYNDNFFGVKAVITIISLIVAFVISTIAYNYGFKAGEDRYRKVDPKLNVLLTVSNGPTSVIPVTLTKNGVGIKFQNSITNIIAIGIEEVNKRD